MEEQLNTMVNPNQVWFPHVVTVRYANQMQEKDGYADEKFNKEGMAVMDVISDIRPEVGDVFYFNSQSNYLSMQEVLEERPAAGDWSGAFWRGVHPTKYRCLVTITTAPKKD